MKTRTSFRLGFIGLQTVCLTLITSALRADDFTDYDTAAGQRHDLMLPTVEGGWFVAVDFFPENTGAQINSYNAEGRAIAANNRTIYLQKNYGASKWVPVATLSEGITMDPCFIRVSPSGDQIALGVGYLQPLVVFPTSILSIENPPNLATDSRAQKYSLDYYDAEWLDEQYLLFNGGSWPEAGNSRVSVLDTYNPSDTGTLLIADIPGASADVSVDNDGNVITGIGWAPETDRTGEIKVWHSGDVYGAIGGGDSFDYDTTGLLVAKNVLSSAHLGVDVEGNLHVGGGDAFGIGGAAKNGYAALIHHSVLADIISGERIEPVDDTPGSPEYKELAPDPLKDDSATSVVYSSWGRGLAVIWNPNTLLNGGSGGPGSATDYWVPGVTPVMSLYTPSSAPDTDGDGIPDIHDNAYLTYQKPGQFEDHDDDGWANIADADLNNDGVVDELDFIEFQNAWGTNDPVADLDGNGIVDLLDYMIMVDRWGTFAPYY